tara:strand:+ start:142 stop:510 length:369 start_codon:yes stop_codon:yes gene_type:complete
MSKLKEFMCYTHNDIIDGEPINIDTSRTSFKGHLNCSYQHLVASLGEPLKSDCIGGKSDANWELEFGYGEVATIYNWKNGTNYLGEDGQLTENITDWHIGGHSKDVVRLVQIHLGLLNEWRA